MLCVEGSSRAEEKRGLVKAQRDMHRRRGEKEQAWKRNLLSDLDNSFDIMLDILYFQGKQRAGNVHTYVCTYLPAHPRSAITQVHTIPTYALPVQHSLSIHSVVPYSVGRVLGGGCYVRTCVCTAHALHAAGCNV